MRNEWNGRVQKEKWNISLQIIYTFPSRFVPCSELKDEIFGIILVTWIETVTSETWHITFTLARTFHVPQTWKLAYLAWDSQTLSLRDSQDSPGLLGCVTASESQP